jgi:hypothetical protein
MNSPAKHHFNPAFSLKPWAGTDEQLCEMKRINGKVVAHRRHPNATGFQKNLYRTDGVGAEHEQHLELKVMKPLDTAAERALKKIRSGDSAPWSSEERSAWTRYILSLMFRNPHAVRELKSHVREMHRGRTQPTDAEVGATNLLIDIIDNDRLGPSIFDMNWSRLLLTDSTLSLLNSDRPLDRPLGLNDPRAYVAFPIAPDMLFLAAHDITLAHKIFEGNHTLAAKQMNRTVVSQAREFVWGVDDRQLPFVQKHMGTAPERTIFAERQRQEALDVAQGRKPIS